MTTRLKGNSHNKNKSRMLVKIFVSIIIIIIIVSLGYFYISTVRFSGSIGPNNCGFRGYSCKTLLLNYTGYLSFSMEQNTGMALNHIQFACAANTTSTGTPYDTYNAIPNPYQYIGPNGTATFTLQQTSLANGQAIFISRLLCFNAQGKPMNISPNNALGTSFSGILYLNYTLHNTTINSSNPWHTVKFATITVKVT